MTDQERAVMQQALEALEQDNPAGRTATITALRAALAQEQPEPVQEPLVWEPVVRDRPWPYLTALTQREYDALHADLRWNYKKITPPKAEPVQEPGQDLIPPDSLFVCGQMGAHVTRVRLAEPAQEPVAWMYPDDYAGILKHQSRAEVFQKAWCNPAVCVPLYTAPQPQRPRLTDEEMLGIIDDAFEGASLLDVARAVERKVRGE